MIDLIIEEIHNNKGKCIIFVGESQFRVLIRMANTNYNRLKDIHTLFDCEIVEVKRKSFLKIMAI